MAVTDPWETLRFISKIEIVPGQGKKDVRVTYDEEWQHDDFYGSAGCVSNVVSRSRTLHLTDETVKFVADYPDDFKKLVAANKGDKAKAYEMYQALQKPVPEGWEVCDLDGENDCNCCTDWTDPNDVDYDYGWGEYDSRS